MKTNYFKTGIVFLLLIVNYSCKKVPAENEKAGPVGKTTDNIKTWYYNKTNTSPTGSAARGNVFQKGNPDWEKTVYNAENSVYITPIEFSDKSNEQQNLFYKFLLSKVNSIGMVTQADYVFVFPDSKKPKSNLAYQTANTDLLFQKDIPQSFSGAVLQYSIDNKLISSKQYDNGQLTDKKAVIIAKGENSTNNGISINSAIYLPCGECESYYLVTYNEETGEIYNVEYLYSECGVCEDGTTGGGGGNGGGPSPEGQANAILDVWQQNTTSPGTLISATAADIPTNTRTVMYKWKAIKGLGWQIESIEKGVHVKINNPKLPPDQQWKWQSLEHVSHTLTGFVIGGTVNPSVVFANTIIGTYNATMNVEFHIAMSTSIFGVSYERNFSINTSKTFNVNGSPYSIPGY